MSLCLPSAKSFALVNYQTDLSVTWRTPSRTFATVASSSDTVENQEPAQTMEEPAVVALGTVVANHDGFLAVRIQDDDSEAGDLLGKQVILPNHSRGLVVVHRPPLVFCYTDDNEEKPTVEGKVKVLQSLAKVSAQSSNTVDALGRLVGADINTAMNNGRAIFSPIPKVGDISLINAPVLTGITMVDALAPIGRGQNMLWITHDLESSRQYLLDWVQQLCNDGTPVVYAALDTEEATLSQLPDAVQVVKRINSGGTNKEAPSSTIFRSAEGVAMAGSACALAEQHAREHGRHAVVIVDTLDGHKTLWDATTRALVDVFGIDAVVKGDRDGGASSEMRAFYSSLIQRSAQYKASKGGGSVTLVLVTTIPPAVNDDGSDRVFAESDFSSAPAKVQERIQLLIRKKIPLTEANLRKIQIPIPSDAEGRHRLVLQHTEDLISMSDGQIWLDEGLAKAGQWPPMDPQRSVTRIGIGADTVSRADAPALRKVVEGLRLLLSQAKDNLEGVSESSSKATQKQILRQKALWLVLHQEPGSGARRLSDSCALLLAASEGLLDSAVQAESVVAGQEAGAELLVGILHHLRTSIPDVLEEIDATLDLTEENRRRLLEALRAFLD